MRVLVTGGSGFTGKHLQVQLAKCGYETRSLASNLTSLEDLKTEVYEYQPTAVIHLAGIAQVGYQNIDEIYNINLIGTRNLLSALAISCPHITCVLIISSAQVYGNVDGGLLKETSEIVPGNDYAVSKYAMELMANNWLDKLPIVLTRPFNYTGVGQTTNFIIPKIIQHFKEKRADILLGNVDLQREFGDVRDVVEIYRKLVENPPVGETLNICTSQPHRLLDVIEECSTITGHEIEIKLDPNLIRKKEPEKLIGDGSKLLSLIPDQQRRNLSQTLSWMLNDP